MFRDLLDNFIRSIGYYTASDVEMCVRSAEEEAFKSVRSHAPTLGTQHSDEQVSRGDPAPPSGRFRYFVSYSVSGDEHSFGCMEILRQQTIQSFDDIIGMGEVIKEVLISRHGYHDPGVVILNWQPFEPHATDGGKEPIPEESRPNVVLRLVA